MATHKSAIKRIRQSEKRRLGNRAALSTMKTVIKKVHSSLEGKDPQKISEQLREAVSYIDKIADKKIIHKNRAGRMISRLTTKANRASNPK